MVICAGKPDSKPDAACNANANPEPNAGGGNAKGRSEDAGAVNRGAKQRRAQDSSIALAALNEGESSC